MKKVRNCYTYHRKVHGALGVPFCTGVSLHLQVKYVKKSKRRRPLLHVDVHLLHLWVKVCIYRLNK